MHTPRSATLAFARRLVLAAMVALTALAAQPDPGAAQEEGEILVLAAASLTDVLPAVADAWRAAGGGRVRFSFDATSRLAPQAIRGGSADVFFSADASWMTWLQERGAVEPDQVRTFLENELVVVRPSGRTGPSTPDDLADVGTLALGGENVPVGRYAREALLSAGVWEAVSGRVVRGGSARGTLEWVARGEVDAGVVYRTDAVAGTGVEVAFPLLLVSGRIRLPAAPLVGSDRPDLARAFVDFAAGPTGRAIFRRAGFSVDGVPGDVLPQEALAVSGPSPVSAIQISLMVALLATLAGLPLAVGVGWLLARRDFPGKAAVSTVVLAPLVVPPVVTGFLLLSVLGSQSPIGRALESLGLPVPFSLLGAAVAAAVVGFPLYVLSVRNAFEAVDPHFEEVSWTLGVRPKDTFMRVSLPLALPGIAAGAMLAFARALGEFGATVVLAGNVEGQTRTIALAVYTLLESPAAERTTWILLGASVALSLAALLGYETLSRRQRKRLEVHREA